MHADPLSGAAILDLLQKLIRIPSVNPVLAPGECPGEEAIARFAATWMQEHGLAARIEEVAPDRFNAIGETGTGPTLVFCAHLDTVSAKGMDVAPFDGNIEDDRVYGRGSYDMKGGVAACMAAAAAIARASLPVRVVVALVCDEEYASIGADHFVQNYNADAAILTEPSEGGPDALVLAHKGFVWAEVVTHGVAAHGSRWDLGESAIAKMAPIITALDNFDRNILRKRTHPLVGPASMHCAMVDGGIGYSTYAPECRLRIERRTIPGETAEDAIAEIEEVIRGTGTPAEVHRTFDRGPMTCPPDAPIARCVRDAAAQVLGRIPADAGVAYWMDAAVFDAAGVPTVNIGSLGAGAHGAIEWVDLPSVVQVARILAESARGFARLATPSA